VVTSSLLTKDNLMIKIVSANLNGIRSASRKGFFTWMNQGQPDIVCIQETKAQTHQLEDEIFHPQGYSAYFSDAEKKGYSGVAIYTRHAPDQVIHSLDFPLADSEGRFIQADFGKLSVVSVYFPSGTSGEERQQLKYTFMDFYEKQLREHQGSDRQWIICGDINIAHTQKDIKNWRGNQKNSGFLPEERAWLDTLFDDIGIVDAFRVVNQEEDQYTWWSNRGRAYENNVGWRIDYHLVSPSLKSKIKKAEIYKAEKFSDHAPLIIDYGIEL
jgi:exodeoxyribonuclease-3